MVGEMVFCFYLEGTLFCLAGVVEIKVKTKSTWPRKEAWIYSAILARQCVAVNVRCWWWWWEVVVVFFVVFFVLFVVLVVVDGG